ncbi:MAG: hypothetical protein ABIR36_09455 [Nitrospiraceae bacterium]
MFKANMAMGGDQTLAKLAQRVEVHPHQTPERKRQLSERAARSLAVEPRRRNRRLI